MELKEKLVSSFLAFETTIDTESSVHDIRKEAMKSFEVYGFPSKKLEAWKYTSLNSILKQDFALFPKTEVGLDYKDVKQYFINDLDSYKIVFIDGKYSSHLSSTTHDKFDVCLMSSALTQSRFKAVIDVYFNTIAKEDGLTTLNTALYIFLQEQMEQPYLSHEI